MIGPDRVRGGDPDVGPATSSNVTTKIRAPQAHSTAINWPVDSTTGPLSRRSTLEHQREHASDDEQRATDEREVPPPRDRRGSEHVTLTPTNHFAVPDQHETADHQRGSFERAHNPNPVRQARRSTRCQRPGPRHAGEGRG
jgi:hypothetical protein